MGFALGKSSRGQHLLPLTEEQTEARSGKGEMKGAGAAGGAWCFCPRGFSQLPSALAGAEENILKVLCSGRRYNEE